MPTFTTIASYRDLPLAELAKAKLESEGIYCHLLDQYHIGINWLYSNALGGIKVQVRTEDVAIANQILNEDLSSYVENHNDEFEPLDQDDLCDRCGSPNLELVKYSRLSAALMLLTGLFLFFGVLAIRAKIAGTK